MKKESFCEADTFQIGKQLGMQAIPGEIYLLEGDLGVGKTIFTKGFAEGLEITEVVTSPTFTILHEYEDGRLPLYHFDVYRIEEPEEMDEIGFESYLYGDGVCLIEWASRIAEILPETCIQVRIEKNLEKGFDFRNIEISSDKRIGDGYENTCD